MWLGICCGNDSWAVTVGRLDKSVNSGPLGSIIWATTDDNDNDDTMSLKWWSLESWEVGQKAIYSGRDNLSRKTSYLEACAILFSDLGKNIFATISVLAFCSPASQMWLFCSLASTFFPLFHFKHLDEPHICGFFFSLVQTSCSNLPSGKHWKCSPENCSFPKDRFLASPPTPDLGFS